MSSSRADIPAVYLDKQIRPPDSDAYMGSGSTEKSLGAVGVPGLRRPVEGFNRCQRVRRLVCDDHALDVFPSGPEVRRIG